MKSKHLFPHISLYAGLLTLLLAAGWLLPNHYPPWNTFHGEAWIAAALGLIGFWVLLRHRVQVNLSWFSTLLFLCALLPVAQHALGLLPLRVQALFGTLFITGFALAYLLGSHWQRLEPDRGTGMLLTAALLAAVVSVALQLYQWSGQAREMDFDDIWVVPFPGGGRPYANMAQPNQLASLLLWGLTGLAWVWHKRRIGNGVAVLLAMFVLSGVALTESRTALLSLTGGIVLFSLWRPSFVTRSTLRAAQMLYLYYVAFLLAIGPLSRALLLDVTANLFVRTGGELRWPIWHSALDASMRQPWFGYGWNQTPDAYLLVYPDHPKLAGIFVGQSHSLPLDLILWFGWPLGLLLLAAAGLWLFRLARGTRTMEQLLCAAAIGVMVVHALLELPLHHGYFLWPLGLLAGAAAESVRAARPLLVLSPKVVAFALGSVVAVSGVVVRDYFLVEEAFVDLRFQLLRIGSNHREAPPDVYLLTEWPEFMDMTRATPRVGMSVEEIQAWQNLLIFHTSPGAFTKLVAALSLNDDMKMAKYWAIRSCSVMAPQTCKALLDEWLSPSKSSLSGANKSQ
jgi:hypothetical protein